MSATPAPPRSSSNSWLSHFSLPRVLLAVAIVAYACAFISLTVVRYAAFEARALDMGNLNQAIWNTAHGNWFHLTNQPGTVNRLSLHVEPILIPISWVYLLYPDPALLLVVQAVVVALGAIPLFALARTKLGNEWVALAFAVVYLINPTMQAANWLEFHPITLAPTFLMAAFYYLITDRPGRFALFAILAASCKEEVALLILMMGLYALLVLRRPRLGWITIGLSMAWALLAVLGIQQLFADGNIHWGRYGYLGNSPSQMLLSLFTRFDLVWNQLVAANAGGYLWSLLWPTAFLALLAPEVLILALPSLAINLLADFPPMHETHTLIYAAPIVPFVLMAAVMGLARLKEWMEDRNRRVGLWVAPALAVLILIFAVTDQRLHGYLPGSGNYLHLTITPHHQRAAALIAQIPAKAVVSAQDRLNPHVSGRETVYIFPRLGDEESTGEPANDGNDDIPADTVFVDVTGPAWPQHPNDLHTSIDALLAKDFGIVAADDGYLLLQRGVENKTIPDNFYSAWEMDANESNGTLGLQADGLLELLDFRIVTDRYGEAVAEMEWMPLTQIDRDLRFYLAFVDADGNMLHSNDYYQPVSVLWYPTTLWEPGKAVRIRTLPWTPQTEKMTPLLGVYDGENWAEGEQLSLTQTGDAAQPRLPLLQGGKVVRLGAYQRDAAGNWQPLVPSENPPATALNVDFGGLIHLAGVDLPAKAQAGIELPFTLYWQALAPMDFDYTAFAHLLDAQGNTVTQLDWQPHDYAGLLPTSAWPQEWPVTDSRRLALPPDLPAGEYQLLVGLYNWQTGERLPVQKDTVNDGDALNLGPIRIEP